MLSEFWVVLLSWSGLYNLCCIVSLGFGLVYVENDWLLLCVLLWSTLFVSVLVRVGDSGCMWYNISMQAFYVLWDGLRRN